MNKSNIGYFAFGACSIVLASFAVLQQMHIDTQNGVIQTKEIDYRKVSTALDVEKKINARLLDSIQNIQEELIELQELVSEQENIILELSGKMSRRDKKFDELEKKIKWLEKDKDKNAQRIRELEEEKTQLLQQMHEIETVLEEKKQELKGYIDQNLEKEIQQKRLERIQKIVNQTWVDYHEVTLRKKEHRGHLSKIKEGDSNWRYTLLNFTLNHVDLDMLVDAEFIVKIINSSTGEILQYIEANPEFPSSSISQTGVRFKFDKNPVTLTHINNQAKVGNDFEVRIYYLENGEEHLLTNSVRAIVHQGKSVDF